MVGENHKAHPIDAVCDERDKLREQIRRLRKHMAELRKDKARMDELERMISSCSVLTNFSKGSGVQFFHGASGHGSLRQFIDRRIKARKDNP